MPLQRQHNPRQRHIMGVFNRQDKGVPSTDFWNDDDPELLALDKDEPELARVIREEKRHDD